MIQGRLHHLLADAFAAKFRTHDDGAEEREAVIRGRRENAHDPAVRFDDETSLGRQRQEPDEVGAGVTPVLQVRQGDRGADVVLVEPSDLRSFHIFTRRSSSSTSSHSW